MVPLLLELELFLKCNWAVPGEHVVLENSLPWVPVFQLAKLPSLPQTLCSASQAPDSGNKTLLCTVVFFLKRSFRMTQALWFSNWDI